MRTLATLATLFVIQQSPSAISAQGEPATVRSGLTLYGPRLPVKHADGIPFPTIVTDRLLDALERGESRGNAAAVGDHGLSAGPFQMKVAACIDANRLRARFGLPAISPRRRTDRASARQLAGWYLYSLAATFTAARGTTPTTSQLIQLWSAGPTATMRRGFSAPIPRSTQGLLTRMSL